MSAAGAAGDTPRQRRVPAARLVATLGVAGTVAGALLVVVFHLTQPAIRAHKLRVLEQAVAEVLGGPDRYRTLYVHDGRLVDTPPAPADAHDAARVYVGYRGETRIGYAVAGGRPGFQDVVRIIFGYDARSGTLLGMKVLESRETPGLGDKIETDQAFVGRFRGAVPPLRGVTRSRASGARDEIDMITGATISSRTVVRIINEELQRVRPLIDRYEPRQ